MTTQEDTRDRVITVEADLRHLTTTVEEMDEKLTEIHSIMTKAQGIRWMIAVQVSFVSFLAAVSGALVYWLNR